jgi:hypothetical protein
LADCGFIEGFGEAPDLDSKKTSDIMVTGPKWWKFGASGHKKNRRLDTGGF